MYFIAVYPVLDTQVCPPGLHITLGVFFRLWCLLEEDCHQLDLELAMHTSPKPTDRKSYAEYSALVKELSQLTERRNELQQLNTTLNAALCDIAIHLPNAESNPLVKALKEEASSTALKLTEVVR